LLAETVGDTVEGSLVCTYDIGLGTSDCRPVIVGLSDSLVEDIGWVSDGAVLGAWEGFVGDSVRPSDGTGVRSAVGRSVSAGSFTVGETKGGALEGKELGRTREFVGFIAGSVVVRSKLGTAHCSFDGYDDSLLEGASVDEADVDGTTDGARVDETLGAFEVTNVFTGALVTRAATGALVTGPTIGD
jgi:hypothetical protein